MNWDDIGEMIIALVAVVFYLFSKLGGKRNKEAAEAELFEVEQAELAELARQEAELARQEAEIDSTPVHTPLPSAPRAVDQGMSHEGKQLFDHLEEVIGDAEKLAREARIQRATASFASTLDEVIVGPGKDLLRQILGSGDIPPFGLRQRAKNLEIVLSQIETFIGQRRDPKLRKKLGDADALALSCYEPMIDFARAENLPLTSATPVSQLGAFDLSIWTGFIPTGLAPLFLPYEFFERVAWWPAIAHEIGHDFLAATGDTEQQLRHELGLVSEAEGSRPILMGRGGLTMEHLTRLFGAWFEEIFCDVFGTLMLGPAYGAAMLELFADPEEPLSVIGITRDASGRRYDRHPPRHLRVMLCAALLDLLGQEDDASRLVRHWSAVHPELENIFLLSSSAGWLALDADPIFEIGLALVERLTTEPFHALSGYRLTDIPGVDFGPAENARAERAKAEFLAGRILRETNNPRAIIAGAVLAAYEAPERKRGILELARRSISALGTAEHRANAYEIPMPPVYADTAAKAPLTARETFILHTILAPLPSVRKMRPIGARGEGLLGRVQSARR